VWEQKTDDGSVHDKDNEYTWNTAANGTTPNGTAFTAFLGTLNNATSGDAISTSGCFAGHCDWRLPAIQELMSIVDLAAPGCSTSTGPCIDQAVFGPTHSNAHWSATTYFESPDYAWFVTFSSGITGWDFKSTGGVYARAVRSGL
jgi:hypothetical protein